MDAPFQLGCQCGKIKGRLLSDNGLHLQCWCTCCVDFAKWMESRRSEALKTREKAAPGVEAFQFFRDEVLLDSGEEFIVGTKLTKETATVRYISTCCNMLLFATPDRPSFIPLVSLSADFIVDRANTQPFNGPVQYRVFAAQAANETPNEAPVRDGLHYSFLLRTVARLLKGLLLRKHKPNPADQVDAKRTLIIADE